MSFFSFISIKIQSRFKKTIANTKNILQEMENPTSSLRRHTSACNQCNRQNAFSVRRFKHTKSINYFSIVVWNWHHVTHYLLEYLMSTENSWMHEKQAQHLHGVLCNRCTMACALDSICPQWKTVFLEIMCHNNCLSLCLVCFVAIHGKSKAPKRTIRSVWIFLLNFFYINLNVKKERDKKRDRDGQRKKNEKPNTWNDMTS